MKKINFSPNSIFDGISQKKCEEYFESIEWKLSKNESLTLERTYAFNFGTAERPIPYDEADNNLKNSKFFTIVKADNMLVNEQLLIELSDREKGFIVESGIS